MDKDIFIKFIEQCIREIKMEKFDINKMLLVGKFYGRIETYEHILKCVKEGDFDAKI